MIPSLLGAVMLAAFCGLLWQNRAAFGQRRIARAAYFDEVAPLFQSLTRRVEPSGFTRLSGLWNGLRFDLQAVPDTLTFRKLPTLWVMVTLTESVAVAGEVHVMMRPTGSEVFSHYGLMPDGVALPAGYPDDCALRCEDPSRLPLNVIADEAALFQDRSVKELVLSPKGLRIVLLGEEAERGRYLLYRDAEMGRRAFAAARLLPVLHRLTALHDRLNKEAAHG